MKSYKNILSSGETKVVISGEPGVGKSCIVKLMVENWINSNLREGEPITVLLDIKELNSLTPITLKEALNKTYPKYDCYDFIEAHKEQVVLILDGVDEHLDEKVSDIRQVIVEWKKVKIWLFVRPDALNSLQLSGFTRYDLTATQDGMSAYIDELSKGNDKKIKTWLGKYKELSAKLLQEPLVLAYLCKRPSEGFSDLKPKDLLDELCSEELGDNEDTRQTIEYMALCQILLEQCHFSPETKYETTPLKEVIYVNFDSIQEQNDSLYQKRNIQKDGTTMYEIDFSSNLVQVYLAYRLLISNDQRVTRVFNESIPINLINFVKSCKIFDPELEISTNDEPPLVAMPIDADLQVSTNDIQAVLAMPIDPDHQVSANDKPHRMENILRLLPQKEQELLQHVRQPRQNIPRIKYSIAINLDDKRLAGLSSLVPDELINQVKVQSLCPGAHAPFLYLAFTADDWENTILVDSELQTILKSYLQNQETKLTNFSVDQIHLVGQCNKQNLKEIRFVFGPIKVRNYTLNCITVYCDYDILRVKKGDNLVKSLCENKLAHLSLTSYAWSFDDIKSIIYDEPTMKELQSLNLSGILLNAKQSDKLKSIFPAMTKLRSLNLNGCRMLSPDDVLKGLQTIDCITNLDLQETKMVDKALEPFIQVLKSNKQLQHLDVKSCRFDRESMKDVLKTLSVENTLLTYLNIGFNCVPKRELSTFIKDSTNLTHLILNDIKLSEELEVGFQICPVKSLFKYLKEQEIITQIKWLNLSNLPLEGCETELLVVCPALEHLYLSCSTISVASMKKILKGLKERPNKLESLDLSEYPVVKVINEITDLQLDAISVLYFRDCEIPGDTIVNIVTQCPVLKRLDLTGNDLGDRGIKGIKSHLKQLEYLNLKACRIGIDGIQHLVTALGQDASLQFLNLSENLFAHRPDKVKKLTQSLNANLQHLGLEHCGFDVISLKQFGDNLNAPRLISLNLMRNYIYDKDSKELLTILKKTPRLEKVMLGCNYLTNGITDLLKQLQGMNIKEFDANYLKERDLETFTNTLAKMDNLERIDVSKSNLSITSILAIIGTLRGKSRLYDMALNVPYELTDLVETVPAKYTPINDHFGVMNDSKTHLYVAYPTNYAFTSDGLKVSMDFGKTDDDNYLFEFPSEATPTQVKTLDCSLEYVHTLDIDNRKVLPEVEIRDYPYLKVLNLINLNQDFPSVSESESLKSSLTFLSLTECLHAKRFMTKDVVNMNTLTALILIEVSIDAVNAIVEKLDDLPNLSNLCIEFEVDHLTPFFKNLPDLRRARGLRLLSLAGLRITMASLLSCVKQSPQLSSFGIANCEYSSYEILVILEDTPKLTSLRFQKNYDIDWEGNMALFQGRLKNLMGKLEEFSLIQEFSFTNNMGRCIRKTRETHSCFSTEELVGALFGSSKQFDAPRKEIKKMFHQYKKIKHEIPVLLDCLKSDTLRTLAISEDLYEEGAIALANCFESMPNLSSLKLRLCCFNAHGFEYFFEKIKVLKKLTVLDLSYSDIGEVSTDVVKAAFSELNNLTELYLNYIRLKDLEWYHVIESVKYLQKLEVYLVLTDRSTNYEFKDIGDVLISVCEKLEYLMSIKVGIPSDKASDKASVNEFELSFLSRFKSVKLNLAKYVLPYPWSTQNVIKDMKFYEKIDDNIASNN